MRVEGKVLVVTGGGSGIGRALCVELLERRAKVAAVDVSEKGLAETLKLAGEGAPLHTFRTDITDRAAVDALPAAATARFGAVDGLINCAGIIQPFVRVNELDWATIDRVFSVNW